MIPLTLADGGEELTIRRVSGAPEVRQHLADLGFTVGATVTVISQIGGNMILRVKESRVALDRQLAQKIMV